VVTGEVDQIIASHEGEELLEEMEMEAPHPMPAPGPRDREV
jgi:hypothetical protein